MTVACWTAALSATVIYALFTATSSELAQMLAVPFAVLIVASWAALTVHLAMEDMHDRPDR